MANGAENALTLHMPMPTYLEVDAFALINPIRLLLVDSDAQERERLRHGFEPRFEVIEAAGTAEAVAELTVARHLDAILTSYALDGQWNGVQLLQYVFEQRRNMHRILMHDKWVRELDELQLRERGVVSLFEPKPIDPVKLGKYFRESWECPKD